jgi:hypothetical protein
MSNFFLAGQSCQVAPESTPRQHQPTSAANGPQMPTVQADHETTLNLRDVAVSPGYGIGEQR